MYHTMMRNADGSWSVGRGYKRGQKLRACRAAQESARTYSRRTRVAEYRAGGHPLGDVIASFGEDGNVATYIPDGGGPMRDTASERKNDKRELGDTIDELKSMLSPAQDDVDAATVEMNRATAIVDGIREMLADAEQQSTHADCLHSEAYARLDALCNAIATLRKTYVAM